MGLVTRPLVLVRCAGLVLQEQSLEPPLSFFLPWARLGDPSIWRSFACWRTPCTLDLSFSLAHSFVTLQRNICREKNEEKCPFGTDPPLFCGKARARLRLLPALFISQLLIRGHSGLYSCFFLLARAAPGTTLRDPRTRPSYRLVIRNGKESDEKSHSEVPCVRTVSQEASLRESATSFFTLHDCYKKKKKKN